VLQCDYQQIESVLKILQGFDPAGIFARDLAECLSLQLKEKNRLDPAMQMLLANLDLFAKRDFKSLCKICGVDEEDLSEMCDEIKALNPKPGNIFSSEHVQVLYPDVFLKKGEKGKWHLELNSEALPKVLVNRRYYSEVESQLKDKESKKFLSEQYNTANWLVKALDQRANTILKVATEIVSQQDNFFRYGIHHIKPLVLSDIAQGIEMHESTVSRVINGKYIATHMGVYELKYFFSSSVSSSSGGEDVSSKRIKFMIKGLIDNENSKAILSDDKIAAMLKSTGVDVARRTVMKYREAMNIPSSVQRRRDKNLGQ
jgi:RNA polymerase sigma-54 factor